MQPEDVASSEMLTQIEEPCLNKCLQGKKKNLESKLMLRSGMKQIGDRFLSTAWVIILALSIISESGFPGLEEVLVELCVIVPIRSCIVNAKPDTIQVSHHLLASQVQKALCRTFC